MGNIRETFAVLRSCSSHHCIMHPTTGSLTRQIVSSRGICPHHQPKTVLIPAPISRQHNRKRKQRCRTAKAVSKYDDNYGRKRSEEPWGGRPKTGLEARDKILKPSTILPIVIGLVVASSLGPLVLALAAGAAGLAVATVAGVTALTVFLPVLLFVGGTVAAFSIVGSLFSLLGLVPLAAAGWFLYKALGNGGSHAADSSGRQIPAVDDVLAREERRQQEDLELYKQQNQELEDFDRRLRNK